MKYQLVKRTNKTLPSYGKYVAKAVHLQTVTADSIMSEIERNCSAKKSDVAIVMTELMDVITRHLQNGERVEIPALGTMKLEIDSRAVDTPEEFCTADHLRRVKLSILPVCSAGKPLVYRGIPLEKMQ